MISKLGAVGRRTTSWLQLSKTMWRGLIVALPIGIIIWIIYAVLNAINTIGNGMLSPFVSEQNLVWGMGLALVMVLIYILGRVELHYAGRPNNIWLKIKRKTVGKIPLFGPFFVSGDKNVISLEDLGKMTPCKFWLSDVTPHYGFIIREQPVRGAETELDIYRPNVPTIIPGDLFPMKKRMVIKLGNPAGEILDKLASGGFIGSEEEIPVPWDDETEEEFSERINLTPLEIAVKRVLGNKFKNLTEDMNS